MNDTSRLSMPDPFSEYLVRTLNHMGVVSTYVDQYAEQFICYASQQQGPVLDIGAAYGTVSIAALKAGATVIANDIELQHLQILYNRTPEECRSRLTLLHGKFPNVLTTPHLNLSGCFISRTLGHLKRSELQDGFKLIFSSLKENAKFFIITGTPYTNTFKNIIPVYEQRILANEQWPGYFTSLKQFVEVQHAAYVPDTINFLDETVLRRELGQIGFIVEECHLFERKDLPPLFRLDGREALVTIARKPCIR
jgi:SAM-dependent methyltransferase